MKAAVCYEFGQPLVIEELELAPPDKGEVKVRLAATAICHSDIHNIRGDQDIPLPIVMGHEAAGVVVEVGTEVTLAKPGDRVIVSLLRSCGRCFYCLNGSAHLCEGKFAADGQIRLHNQRGEPVQQGLHTGAFAEYTVVDQSQVVQVPEDLPLDQAALLACGVITGVGAVINTAQVKANRSVVVIGVGGVGLNAVQAAAMAGAHPIVAVDLLAHKLAAAHTFGARYTLNSSEVNAVEAVMELTSGRGADYVFVTVGSQAAMAQGLKMIGRQGTLVMVGLPHHQATVSLPIFPFVLGEQKIMSSLMGSTRLRIDVPRLIARYQQGQLKLAELITTRYPLTQINEAIEAVERGEALRNVIVFDTT
jgi:Zn-dependent alcohol dehydrogenase